MMAIAESVNPMSSLNTKPIERCIFCNHKRLRLTCAAIQNPHCLCDCKYATDIRKELSMADSSLSRAHETDLSLLVRHAMLEGHSTWFEVNQEDKMTRNTKSRNIRSYNINELRGKAREFHRLVTVDTRDAMAEWFYLSQFIGWLENPKHFDPSRSARS